MFRIVPWASLAICAGAYTVVDVYASVETRLDPYGDTEGRVPEAGVEYVDTNCWIYDLSVRNGLVHAKLLCYASALCTYTSGPDLH